MDLESTGFVLNRSSFIRESENHLYQIIEISLGPSHSMMANHIGISFGIATEEWINNLNNWRRPKILTTADCEIQSMYLDAIGHNPWIKMEGNVEEITHNVKYQIFDKAIPFLNQLKTRKQIMVTWTNSKKNIGLPPRMDLSMAILNFYYTGKEDEESMIKLMEENITNDFYVETIKNIIK